MPCVPRDGTATRTRILDAAEQLMERNGFAATSVEAILDASGSSKGAFFHHFDSKRDLARALMTRYVDADLEQLRLGLVATEELRDPAERLVAFVRHFEAWAEELMREDSACLYIAALSEEDLLDEEISGVVRRGILTWREEVAALVAAAFTGQAAPPAVDPDALADHLFATFEGGYLLCRSLGSTAPMRQQLTVFRQLLEALLTG